MSLSHLALLIQPPPVHHSSCVPLRPHLITMEHSDRQANVVKFCIHNTSRTCLPRRFAVSTSIVVVPLASEERESSNVIMTSESNCNLNSHYDESRSRGHHSELVVTCSMDELKEIQRRKRIGLANKGKVPWNKGRKHSPETCARIKERTLEAMRDPKVKRKMSEAPRMHSEHSKKKIGYSIRQLWAERLKWKRSKERFYSLWVESISEAARKGGINEEELNWDTYERLKAEITLRQLQWAAKKAKEKEMKRIRAEKRLQKRAEKMALLAQKKMPHKPKDESEVELKETMSSKTREKKEDLAVSTELNLRARLTKIHGKKLIDGQLFSEDYRQSILERFDIESIEKEQRRNTVSLAEQIQAAKRKRTPILASESSITTSSLGR